MYKFDSQGPNLSFQYIKVHIQLSHVSIFISCKIEVVFFGGDETWSGYVQYVLVISANVPCTYSVQPLQGMYINSSNLEAV